MPISRSPHVTEHLNHQVEIQPVTGNHKWRLVCSDCAVHLQWLSNQDCQTLVDAGFEKLITPRYIQAEAKSFAEWIDDIIAEDADDG